MPINIPQRGTISVFVMLVDINRFAEMVSKARATSSLNSRVMF
jgi:hypothetical protein